MQFLTPVSPPRMINLNSRLPVDCLFSPVLTACWNIIITISFRTFSMFVNITTGSCAETHLIAKDETHENNPGARTPQPSVLELFDKKKKKKGQITSTCTKRKQVVPLCDTIHAAKLLLLLLVATKRRLCHFLGAVQMLPRWSSD